MTDEPARPWATPLGIGTVGLSAQLRLATLALLTLGTPTCQRPDAPRDDRAVGHWALEEELRLTGTPDHEFGRVHVVAADAEDNIYVLDIIAQQVYVFDSVGAYSHSIGRPGEGPGELSDARGVGVGPGNRIWIPETATARVSVFESDGTFLGAVPRHGYSGTGVWDRPVDAGGNYVDRVVRFPDPTSAEVVMEHPFVLRWTGTAGHTAVVDSFPPLEVRSEMARIGGMERPVVYFAGDMLRAWDGEGIWFAHSREYRAYRRSLKGDTLLVVERDAEPVPVGEADVQAVREHFAQRPFARYADDYLKALPAEKPVLVALFSDGDGNLFVMPETRRAKGGTAIDAFGPDGEYWGRAELPRPVHGRVLGFIPAYATSRHLLLSGIDDIGQPYVVRLGIRRPG